MTSSEEAIKQVIAALKLAEDRLLCLVKHGLTLHQVWYAPEGALAADKEKVFGMKMSPNDAKIYAKVRELYLKYSRTYSKPQTDDLREHNSLNLIREGFAKEYKCPETLASLNKMLSDIHAFWIEEYKALISAKEQELSQMQMM
jgi:hypothetical protein